MAAPDQEEPDDLLRRLGRAEVALDGRHIHKHLTTLFPEESGERIKYIRRRPEYKDFIASLRREVLPNHLANDGDVVEVLAEAVAPVPPVEPVPLVNAPPDRAPTPDPVIRLADAERAAELRGFLRRYADTPDSNLIEQDFLVLNTVQR